MERSELISPISKDNLVENNNFPSRILLVEDDLAHVQLISRALKNCAVSVIHKENVKDALYSIVNDNIDFVITDLNLVSDSGFELISLVTEQFPHLPLVVLTSSSNLNDAVEAMKKGAWDYLSKHFSGNFSLHLELVLRKTWDRAIEKQKESEAQAERNAFWMAASIADDGLAIIDSGGNILYNNPVFKRFKDEIQEITNGDKKENNIISIISPLDFRLSQNLFEQIHINNDSLWKTELKLLLPETKISSYYELRLSTVISEITNDSIVEDGNSYTYHILWVKNITKDKQAKEFERSILSSASHDLKGPLSAILTSTELLLEDSTSSSIEKSMLRIASCARTSLNLVDQLLSLKRIQDGYMSISPSMISLNDITNELFEEYSPVAKSKNIRFSLISSHENIELFADSLAIKRILGNLLSNAMKFTQSGGEVRIEIEKVKNIIILRVIDNGAGIPLESQDMLFDMYKRLPEHGKIEGSGIGLYITKQLVDMHHGVLELKSTLGSGSTFSVIFNNKSFQESYLEDK